MNNVFSSEKKTTLSKHSTGTFPFAEYEDEIAHWWTTFVAVGCYWLLDDKDNAESMYSKFENVPEAFSSPGDPLPRAAYAAYIARRTYISDRAEVSDKFIMQLCNLASRLLDDSLTYNICKQQNDLILVSICRPNFYILLLK